LKSSNTKTLSQLYPWHLEVPFFIVVSMLLLIKGLFLPVLTIKQLFWSKNTFSILSGIENLFHDKHIALGYLIIFFSVIFPAAKLCALLSIWFARLGDAQKRLVLNTIEILGKWSMLDVFVVAIVIVAIKFGSVTSAKPEIGIYIFGGSILISMIVTMWVDYLAKKASI